WLEPLARVTLFPLGRRRPRLGGVPDLVPPTGAGVDGADEGIRRVEKLVGDTHQEIWSHDDLPPARRARKTCRCEDDLSQAPLPDPIDPGLATRRRLTLIATIIGSSMTFID